MKITRLGHAAFTTSDVPRLEAYYTEVLGFEVSDRDEDGRVYLRNALDHHSILLESGNDPGIRYVAFQIGGEPTLDGVARELKEHGVNSARRSDTQPGIPQDLVFTNPDGYDVQLYTATEHAAIPAPGHGIGPHKLGHVALRVQDVPATAEFYTDVLGFRWSDWLEDFFVFMRSGRDHHMVNFLRSKRRGMHHIGFELADWAHVQRALDHLRRHRIPLIWGPGRHGMGHNIFTYHHDPDGNVIELFTELDVMADEDLGYFEPRPYHEDHPQRPKVWHEVPEAPNAWGIMPPSGFQE